MHVGLPPCLVLLVVTHAEVNWLCKAKRNKFHIVSSDTEKKKKKISKATKFCYWTYKFYLHFFMRILSQTMSLLKVKICLIKMMGLLCKPSAFVVAPGFYFLTKNTKAATFHRHACIIPSICQAELTSIPKEQNISIQITIFQIKLQITYRGH